jgi:hypothetical protein
MAVSARIACSPTRPKRADLVDPSVRQQSTRLCAIGLRLRGVVVRFALGQGNQAVCRSNEGLAGPSMSCSCWTSMHGRTCRPCWARLAALTTTMAVGWVLPIGIACIEGCRLSWFNSEITQLSAPLSCPSRGTSSSRW